MVLGQNRASEWYDLAINFLWELSSMVENGWQLFYDSALEFYVAFNIHPLLFVLDFWTYHFQKSLTPVPIMDSSGSRRVYSWSS